MLQKQWQKKRWQNLKLQRNTLYLEEAYIFVGSSACGEIRTANNVPVLTAPTVPCWHKVSWERVIVRRTTTRRLPHGAKGLFYPSWNRLYIQCGWLPGTDLTTIGRGTTTTQIIITAPSKWCIAWMITRQNYHSEPFSFRKTNASFLIYTIHNISHM